MSDQTSTAYAFGNFRTFSGPMEGRNFLRVRSSRIVLPASIQLQGSRSLLAPALLVIAALALSACGSRGVAEFQLYSQAFSAQYEQGDHVLNVVAKAERTVVRRRLARKKGWPDFDPKNAAYYVDNVDPPIAATIRGSLKSIKAYNEALTALANGEAAEALTSRIGVLATNIASAIAASQVAVGGAAQVLNADKLVAESSGILVAVKPIFKQAAAIASREEFRSQLTVTFPIMKDLLISLRNGSPVLFDVIVLSYREHSTISKDNKGALTKASIDAIETTRVLFGGWIVLLDQALLTMESAYAAAISQSNQDDLAALNEASIELRVLADGIKKLRNR